jgi:selenocysteine-specific elongation factor
LQTKDLILEIGDQSYLHKKKIMAIIHDLKINFKKKKKLSVSEFKILSGLTRKIAIPLLEYLDDNQYTKRIGNYRIIDIKLND